jgi:predicted membrane protein
VRKLLARALAIVASAALFVGAFVVSVAFLAVVLAIGLIVGSYLVWKSRHLRRQVQQRYDRDVIEGTVISSKEIRSPPP